MCVEELDGVGEKSWKSHEMVQRCRATSGTLQRLRWIFLDCLTLLFSFLSVWGERRKWGEQLVLNWSSGKRLVSATPPAVQAALQLQSILPYKFTEFVLFLFLFGGQAGSRLHAATITARVCGRQILLEYTDSTAQRMRRYLLAEGTALLTMRWYVL